MAEQGNSWNKILISAVSASTAETTTYPLDFIKTRLQLHKARTPQPIVLQITSIVRHEGFSALYAGLSPAILRHLPYTSIRVSTFETIRNWAQRRQQNSIHADHNSAIPLPYLLGAGMFSGALAQAVATPADLLKVRIQSSTLQTKPKLFATFQHIVHQEGITGLWRGSKPAIYRAALVNLGELTTYDVSKRKIIESGVVGSGKDTLLVHVASSMCSGFVSAAVSTPADVVKTRLMSQDPLITPPQYKGMVDCLHKTVAGEGVRGLYKGFLPTWARLGPWQLCFWVTFEQLRRLQGIGGF